jgi:anti-sigma B factor antagonist
MTTIANFQAGRRPDGTPVLTVTGEVDMSNAGALGAALTAALPGEGALALDLTAVTYLDTSGLACLFAHARRLDITVTDTLATVLAISGLADLARVRVTGPGPSA